MLITSSDKQIVMQGNKICGGTALGQLFLFEFLDDHVPSVYVPVSKIQFELERYELAIQKCVCDLQRLRDSLYKEKAAEAGDILETHMQILQDTQLGEQVRSRISEKKLGAEFAFYSVIREYEQKFFQMKDPYFREKSKDLKDVCRRVLSYLKRKVRIGLKNLPKNSVVAATELVPSDVAEADRDQVCAFIVQEGGSSDHAAIIARAKGIPYISGIAFDALREHTGAKVIVNGDLGQIILNPESKTSKKYQIAQNKQQQQQKNEQDSSRAITKDGTEIFLFANLDSTEGIEEIFQYGVQGIGLFRSEMMCLTRTDLPSEEEQFVLYSKVVKDLKGLPVTIRTFDLGGDKLAEEYRGKEKNPALGRRAIRFTLYKKEFFINQIKAILRAALFGPVRILLPMLTDLEELRLAKRLIVESQEILTKEGRPFEPDVPFGSMVEVPSAALISEWVADESEFLSIGTNDLTQYALAVDRTSAELTSMHTPAHPGMIRLIQSIVKSAAKAKIPLTLCGEVASDPEYIALLLGLGIQTFSLPLRMVHKIKETIRNIDMKDARKIARQARRMRTTLEIHRLILQSKPSESTKSTESS